MGLEFIDEDRQHYKVKHSLKDILVIVLFVILAGEDNFAEIDMFAKHHEEYLGEYIKLENGITSHDTINRVVGLISSEIIQQLHCGGYTKINCRKNELIMYLL